MLVGPGLAKDRFGGVGEHADAYVGPWRHWSSGRRSKRPDPWGQLKVGESGFAKLQQKGRGHLTNNLSASGGQTGQAREEHGRSTLNGTRR